MSNVKKGRAYVSPYLLQPIRTLAEVSAELARKTAQVVPSPLEVDAEDDPPTAQDDTRLGSQAEFSVN